MRNSDSVPVLADSLSIIDSLEGGDVKRDLTEAFLELVRDLNDQSLDRTGKAFKGSVTLKLDISITDGMSSIVADITTKAPKRPRRNSVYWALADGRLSSEHPSQRDLFRGPTEVPDLTPIATDAAAV